MVAAAQRLRGAERVEAVVDVRAPALALDASSHRGVAGYHVAAA